MTLYTVKYELHCNAKGINPKNAIAMYGTFPRDNPSRRPPKQETYKTVLGPTQARRRVSK